jgi:hypothetical protein
VVDSLEGTMNTAEEMREKETTKARVEVEVKIESTDLRLSIRCPTARISKPGVDHLEPCLTRISS